MAQQKGVTEGREGEVRGQKVSFQIWPGEANMLYQLGTICQEITSNYFVLYGLGGVDSNGRLV